MLQYLLIQVAEHTYVVRAPRPFPATWGSLVAWLGNFRRMVVSYERRMENFLGFVHLGGIIILL